MGSSRIRSRGGCVARGVVVGVVMDVLLLEAFGSLNDTLLIVCEDRNTDCCCDMTAKEEPRSGGGGAGVVLVVELLNVDWLLLLLLLLMVEFEISESRR